MNKQRSHPQRKSGARTGATSALQASTRRLEAVLRDAIGMIASSSLMLIGIAREEADPESAEKRSGLQPDVRAVLDDLIAAMTSPDFPLGTVTDSGEVSSFSGVAALVRTRDYDDNTVRMLCTRVAEGVTALALMDAEEKALQARLGHGLDFTAATRSHSTRMLAKLQPVVASRAWNAAIGAVTCPGGGPATTGTAHCRTPTQRDSGHLWRETT